MKKSTLFTVLLGACLVTFLFHRQTFGLNVLIIESLFLAWLFITKQFQFKGINPVLVSSALMITSIFTVLTYSNFVIIINLVTFSLFIGILIFPRVYSLTSTLRLSVHAFVRSQQTFLNELSSASFAGRSAGSYFLKTAIFVIPVGVIVVFIWIYRMSNPVFDGLFVKSGIFLQKHLVSFFENFDFLLLATFFTGVVLSNFSIFRSRSEEIITGDQNSSNILFRKRNKRRFSGKPFGLINEYKAGIFLLFILNITIFILNALDIYWVWFNFSWEGQYLKQFVHEGTYLLILSILISIGIVLYYFRGNLNFYSENRFLKRLCYLWILQNGILIISVAIRNFWYIQHFALAYKRIGVFIFLLMTLYGLYTVYMKVRHHKSAFYLYRSNAYSVFIILAFASLFNWENIIAKYNFSHYKHSFVHLNFLVQLPDKSLPHIYKPMSELKTIEKIQGEKFSFDVTYMSPEEYHRILTHRKEEFREAWEAKSILSWNLPEYLAYRKLFGKAHPGNRKKLQPSTNDI